MTGSVWQFGIAYIRYAIRQPILHGVECHLIKQVFNIMGGSSTNYIEQLILQDVECHFPKQVCLRDYTGYFLALKKLTKV